MGDFSLDRATLDKFTVFEEELKHDLNELFIYVDKIPGYCEGV